MHVGSVCNILAERERLAPYPLGIIVSEKEW